MVCSPTFSDLVLCLQVETSAVSSTNCTGRGRDNHRLVVSGELLVAARDRSDRPSRTSESRSPRSDRPVWSVGGLKTRPPSGCQAAEMRQAQNRVLPTEKVRCSVVPDACIDVRDSFSAAAAISEYERTVWPCQLRQWSCMDLLFAFRCFQLLADWPQGDERQVYSAMARAWILPYGGPKMACESVVNSR